MARYSFNPAEVPDDDPATGFEPIPPGVYVAWIVASRLKDTRKGGQGIEFEWELQGGKYAGRRIWQFVNVDVPHSARATEIGLATLKHISRAVLGPDKPWQDTQQLHGTSCEVSVSIEEGRDGYPPRNQIRGVKRIEVVYSQPAAPVEPKPPTVADPPADDDIPF